MQFDYSVWHLKGCSEIFIPGLLKLYGGCCPLHSLLGFTYRKLCFSMVLQGLVKIQNECEKLWRHRLYLL